MAPIQTPQYHSVAMSGIDKTHQKLTLISDGRQRRSIEGVGVPGELQESRQVPGDGLHPRKRSVQRGLDGLGAVQRRYDLRG